MSKKIEKNEESDAVQGMKRFCMDSNFDLQGVSAPPPIDAENCTLMNSDPMTFKPVFLIGE